MSGGTDLLRTELDRTFRPPVDVAIDPSLLVASSSLERLADSQLFVSQTQATLGGSPTEPRVGDLFVPTGFAELVGSDRTDARQTGTWDYFRGQAEPADPDDVRSLLEANDVEEFAADSETGDLDWATGLEDPDRQERIREILRAEYSFLHSGGLVLSRTPTFLEALRDAGVPTVDVGRAQLDEELEAALTDVGYRDPAGVCAFGISSADAAIDALASDILAGEPELLLYRIGR